MSVRFIIIVGLIAAGAAALLLALVATDTALSVWERLEAAPTALRMGILILGGGFCVATMLLTWHWLWPKTEHAHAVENTPPDEDRLHEDLVRAAGTGVDVSTALQELSEQRKRKSAGTVHLALFGEVSTGKSSLARALVPEAQVLTDPRAGTTTEIRQHRWASPSGDAVILSDLPGFNLQDETEVLDEARRAHLVIFLCDEDLTASQAEHLRMLVQLGKPVLVALNKLDRYGPDERKAILTRISEQSGLPREDIVAISAGGHEEVIRKLLDGTEESETRLRPVKIAALVSGIQRHLDENRALMESLRDTAVMTLASEKLSSARDEHRERQSEELIERYSKRAVIGAMAAVAPGSDLVIQGALATRLIQELCNLYNVPFKEVQIETFLKLAGGKVKKLSTITLAITGNALKAFPGIGTLTGGLLHAVAYGLIFESLGKAAAQTLSSRGELRPYPAAEAFEELLSEHLAKHTEDVARMAIEQAKARSSAS